MNRINRVKKKMLRAKVRDADVPRRGESAI
jgi:hypothetical protein